MITQFGKRQAWMLSRFGFALLLFAVPTGCAVGQAIPASATASIPVPTRTIPPTPPLLASPSTTPLSPLDPAAAKQEDDKAEIEKFKDLDQAIAGYTKAIQLDPGNAKYYLDRGNGYDIKSFRDKGSLDLAIADYAKAIDLVAAAKSSFGLPMPPEQLTALLYDYRGVDYYHKGNFDQAIADFSKAIEIYPSLSYPYIHRGVAYRDHGDLDQAIADFTKDITLEPTWAHDYYDRGIAYQRKGQNAQAIADFQMFLKLAPNATERDQVQQWINQLK